MAFTLAKHYTDYWSQLYGRSREEIFHDSLYVTQLSEPSMSVPTEVKRIHPKDLKKGGLYKNANNIPVRALGKTPDGNMILLQYARLAFEQDNEFVEFGCYFVPTASNRAHLGFEVLHETPEDLEIDQDF